MRGMLFFASKPPARSGAEDTYKDLRDIVIPKRFVCNKSNLVGGFNPLEKY